MSSAQPDAKRPGIFTRRPGLRYLAYALCAVGLAWAIYALGKEGWASYQYHAALESAAQHNYVQAGVHVEKYLLIRTWDWEGWLLAARTARQQGNFSHALMFQREAKKRGAPDIAIALEGRLLDVQTGDPQTADDLLTFCATNPERAEARFMLQAIAEGALSHGDVVRARKAANLWLQIAVTPADQAQGHVWLGLADKLANDAGATLTHFQQAVDLAPEHPRARILLVATLVHDQPERARPHLEILRHTHPDDLEVQFQTARMHRYLGDTEQAVQILDHLLQTHTDNVELLLERARVALDLMRPKEAETLLRKALQRAPGHRQVNVGLADCFRQQGRLEDAKVFEARVAEIDKKAKGLSGNDKKP
jgi:tetratricopeptide (TPR) repeat protein